MSAELAPDNHISKLLFPFLTCIEISRRHLLANPIFGIGNDNGLTLGIKWQTYATSA